MRRRSTNQVLSGLFSTSSDKEIRRKSCFASLMESEEKIAATLAGTQVAAAYPVAGACAATKNKETANAHLPPAIACSRRSAGPCHNLGAPAWCTHLRSFSPRKPAGPVRAMAPTCGTNLGHQPAVQVPIKPLTQTSVQVSTFQVSSF